MDSIYKKLLQDALIEYQTKLKNVKTRIPAIDLANRLAKEWSPNTNYINDYTTWANCSHKYSTFLRIGLTKNMSLRKDGFIFLESILDIEGVTPTYSNDDFSNSYYVTYKNSIINITIKDHNCKYEEKTRTITERVLVCS